MVVKDAAWVAAELTKLRKAAGLTQAEAARAMDMDKALVTRRETGKKPFTFSEIPFFAELYGLKDPKRIKELQEAVRRNKPK
jgi:transcriptional regulator with XRE-family HTH domain